MATTTPFARRENQAPLAYIQSPEFHYYALGVRLAVQLHALRQATPTYCPITLAGLCGVATEVVTAHLQRQHIDAHFYEGFYDHDPHCWTQVAGRVIDVTLTQFDTRVAPVYIHPKTRRHHHGQRLPVPLTHWGLSAATRRRLQTRAIALATYAWKHR